MELKDILELLYTAHNRFTSIQVTWQYWYRVDMMNEAYEKWANQHPPGSVSALKTKSAKGGQDKKEIRVLWRVWWQKPSWWRDEQQMQVHGTTIRIVCENRWWSYSSATRRLYTNVAPEQKQPNLRIRKSEHSRKAHLTRVEDAINDVPPLIDPSFLLASHDLQFIDNAIHAERQAAQIRANFRKGKELSRDPFFWSAADEYELLIDKERGILLRYAAKLRGQEFAIASVNQIIFDESLSKDTFFFTPPANTFVEIVT